MLKVEFARRMTDSTLCAPLSSVIKFIPTRTPGLLIILLYQNYSDSATAFFDEYFVEQRRGGY